ncbi:HIT domain-containing protein [Candidatus Omnitrophota bacterium]
MDKLWAPWRMKYVTGLSKKKKCVFCIKASAAADRKNFVIKRCGLAFSILNIYPYNNGHIMIAPRRHVGRIEDLTAEEMSEMMRLLIDTKKLLDRRLGPHGYNIGINLGRPSGAGIDKHIHMHIVPRWIGDSNFMPAISGAKVISDSLDSLYRRLKKRKKPG